MENSLTNFIRPRDNRGDYQRHKSANKIAIEQIVFHSRIIDFFRNSIGVIGFSAVSLKMKFIKFFNHRALPTAFLSS